MNNFPNFAEHCEWQNTKIRHGFRVDKIEILSSYAEGSNFFYTAKIHLSKRVSIFKTERKTEEVKRDMCFTPNYVEEMEELIKNQI